MWLLNPRATCLQLHLDWVRDEACPLRNKMNQRFVALQFAVFHLPSFSLLLIFHKSCPYLSLSCFSLRLCLISHLSLSLLWAWKVRHLASKCILTLSLCDQPVPRLRKTCKVDGSPFHGMATEQDVANMMLWCTEL